MKKVKSKNPVKGMIVIPKQLYDTSYKANHTSFMVKSQYFQPIYGVANVKQI